MKDTDMTSQIKIGHYRIPAEIPEQFCGCFRNLNLVWDRNQKLGFAAPMPSGEDLGIFYGQNYRKIMNKSQKIESYFNSPNYRAQTKSQVEWVVPLVADNGDWLDVGGGFGLLLHEVKQQLPKWGRYAVEADAEAQKSLLSVSELLCEPDMFWKEDAKIDQRFDVISLSHVLEHLIDPMAAINRLSRFLKPSGLLLVEVPNDNLQNLKNSKRKSDLPHLWFFSLEGLSRVIRDQGFRIIRSGEVGFDMNEKASLPWVKRVYRSINVRLKGPMYLMTDKHWYAEGPNRTSLRIIAGRK